MIVKYDGKLTRCFPRDHFQFRREPVAPRQVQVYRFRAEKEALTRSWG